MSSKGGEWERDVANGSVPVGAWTHVISTFDGSDCYFYLNNVLDTTAYTITTDKTFWFSDMGALDRGRIASADYAGQGNVNFLGAILDDFRYYPNHALTADERTHLWHAGNGTELNPAEAFVPTASSQGIIIC